MTNNGIHERQYPEEQEIHLRDYWLVILKRKTTVVTFLIITFLTVFIATYTATPYFTASSQVLIERNESGGIDGRSYYRWDPEFLSTQFELIRSTNVAHNVVKTLKLDTLYRHYFFEPEKEGFATYLSSLKNNVKGFLSGLIASDVPSVTSENNSGLLSITSEPVTDADIIANIIKGGLSIKPVANTKTVHIAYSDKHPAMAKLVANAIVQAYIDEILEIKLANSNYSLQWMTSKADEERNKLEGSELAMQKYVRENDLVTVENKLAVYPQRLGEFSSQLSKAQAELKEYEALYAQIKKLGKNYDNIEMIPLFADNNVLQGLREKLFHAEQKIKDLSKKYGYKHPMMINAKAERNLLVKEKQFEVNRIIESTRNSYELTKSREQNLTQLLAKTKNEMLDVNERFTQYAIMKREVDTSRVLYDALSSSIKKASVTEQSHDINIWVVKKASFPGAPSKPQKKRNLMLGLILGLFGGVGLAFFIEYLDNSVKDGKELEHRFGLTVLGTVEEFERKDGDYLDTWLPKNLLSPVAESYRLIQSNLLLSTPDNPPCSILVTSLSPKEGKTTTTSNLAHILAQNGKKVLIIGCDLRRPRMHRIAAIPNTNGLSNYLTGSKATHLIKTIKEDAIYLITAGDIPPNPAELLHSARMKTLIKEMEKRYDYVLLDSPPVHRVTDSLTLSKLVDGTLLVVRSGTTTYDSMESGLKKFHEIHAKILGFVVNGLKRQTSSDSGYYGYYDYYENDEKEENNA
jgi:polysaccharide biosynthesis transport protein